MTTAVFIGTFDPLHGGHIGQLLRANHVIPLSKVLILVNKNPTHKPTTSNWQHRLKMASLTLESYNLPFEYEVLPVESPLANEISEQIDYKITGIDSLVENIADPARWKFINKWPMITLSIPGIEESILTQAVHLAPNELRNSLQYTYINETEAPMMNYDFKTQAFSHKRVHATHLRLGDKTTHIPMSVQEYIKTHQLYNN